MCNPAVMVKHRNTSWKGHYYELVSWKYNLMMYTYFVSDCILQLGRTKVFLRAGQIAVLDSRRGEILDNASRIVQGHFRTFAVRKKFLSTRKASISIQIFCRGVLDLSVIFILYI